MPLRQLERTLIDITRSSGRPLVDDAVRESLERGLTTRQRLARAVNGQEDRAGIRRDLGIRLPAARESG
jgi:hypothetical protein